MINCIRILLLSAYLLEANGLGAVDEHASRWFRHLAISVDGRTIDFGSSRIGSQETELVGSFYKNQQLYSVEVTGGAVTLLLYMPALDVAVSPDGKTMVYDSCPVYENEWRNGAGNVKVNEHR